MGFYTHISPYFCVAGLPGGAGAPAGVAAEERGDGEQVSESQGGRADGPEPAGEEGAGGHRAGATGTTVRKRKNKHTHTHKLWIYLISYNCELQTSSLKILFG